MFDQEGPQCHMNKIRPTVRTLQQPNWPTPRTVHVTLGMNTGQSTDLQRRTAGAEADCGTTEAPRSTIEGNQGSLYPLQQG